MTISPAVLDAMVAAGCTAEQIAAAVKADMAGDEARKAAKRANNAERQRRHRERNAMSRVTGVSNCDTPSSSPLPLDPPSQTLPPIIPQTPSPSPEKKRGTRLPADWKLPAPWGRWALDQGYSEAAIRLEADKFRDFWISKGGKDAAKLDWEATWRNWIRNSRAAPVGSQAPPGKQSITDVLKQQVQEMQENERREAEEGYGDGEADGAWPPLLGFAGATGRSC